MNKMTTVGFATLALAAGLAAQPVLADSAMDEAFDTPRVMFYAVKRFGAASNRATAPTFGLRFEQPVRGARQRWQMDVSDLNFAPMLDLSLRRGQGGVFSLYNIPVYGYGTYYDSVYGGYGGDKKRQAMVVGGVVVAAMVVSCASDNWPCEEDKNGPESPGL